MASSQLYSESFLSYRLKVFNTHCYVICKVSQHSGRKNKHRCVIRKVSQHSERKNKHCCIIRKILQRFGKKSIKNTKRGCTQWKRGGELIKILHVLLKNSFRGFRNASVKVLKTLGKHISLDIGEREEEKEENQVLYASGAS